MMPDRRVGIFKKTCKQAVIIPHAIPTNIEIISASIGCMPEFMHHNPRTAERGKTPSRLKSAISKTRYATKVPRANIDHTSPRKTGSDRKFVN
jgi:hypothetical protein